MWNLKVVAGFVGAAGLAMLLAPAPALAANPTRTGEFLVDPPTLINLGFEWFIDGDDNRNATVEVRYRKNGETAVEAGAAAAASAAAKRSTTARSWMSSLPTCSPEAFWISNRTPPTNARSRCPIRMA